MGFDVPRVRNIDAPEGNVDSLDADVRELLSDFMGLPKETQKRILPVMKAVIESARKED